MTSGLGDPSFFSSALSATEIWYLGPGMVMLHLVKCTVSSSLPPSRLFWSPPNFSDSETVLDLGVGGASMRL